MSPGGLKVLIVDDHPPVVEALRVLLDVHGIPSVTASAPDAALAALRREPVGAVIQDMNFGEDRTSGTEGVALFRRIREATPDTPVVLITAWASLETAVQLVKEGAADYLSKPWDDDKLVRIVGNLLRMRELQLENARLRAERMRDREALERDHDLCGVVYESEAMQRVVSLATHVARSDAPILITGPSGAGKEKLAEIVHANSRRGDGPMLRVNVGALPAELLESELFGAEPGAYTGSRTLRVGRFEAADGGTIFLDEIDALPLAGQVKLLRVLQSGEFERLGSSTTRRADVRVISATNADLRRAIAGGSFREDLFYRLCVIELAIPPLRQRPDDLLPLARHFLADAAPDEPVELAPEAVRAMLAWPWDGNVRELQNRIRRAVLVRRGAAVTAADLDLGPGDGAGAPGGAVSGGAASLAGATAAGAGAVEDEAGERERIERALLAARGVVARAASELGVSRQALYRRMERLGIVLERRPRH